MPQLARALVNVGGAEATRRANAGIDAGRIVSLSKETTEFIKANGATLDKAGRTLGVVRGRKGFVHVARFSKDGAKAMTASNAATLAVTAALSQQLGEIQKQLTEIQDTLEELKAGDDRRDLADVVATNDELEQIVIDIQRHGEMTADDWRSVRNLSHSISKNARMADFKLSEVFSEDNLSRKERADKLEKLLRKKQMDYWFAFQVQAEIAWSRREMLRLYWEQIQHPETADQLADQIRLEVQARRQRMADLGRALDVLADPDSRRLTDRLRLKSKWELKQHDKVVTMLLEKHPGTFSSPESDPLTVIPGRVGEPVVLEAGERPSAR
jgi:hypothetical protein